MNKDCVSLDIAKKLKEAGWSGECWHEITPKGHIWSTGGFERWCNSKEAIPCPSIGELLEATGLCELKKLNDGSYRAWNHKNDPEPYGHGVENPADALALLWLALKEKNLL